MSTYNSFSSRSSALVLWVALGASLLVGWVSYAQVLEIPSNLENAVISIRDVFLSDNGTKQGNDATIQLLGDSGDIISKWSLDVLNNILWQSDLTIEGDSLFEGAVRASDRLDAYGPTTLNHRLTLTRIGEFCRQILDSSDPDMQETCVLFVDENWNVDVEGFLQNIENHGDDITEILNQYITETFDYEFNEYINNEEFHDHITNIYWSGLRDYTASKDDPDIYFATPTTSDPIKTLVRIGIERTGDPSSTDAHLIVKDEIQTRDAFAITKRPGNDPANIWLLPNFKVGEGVAESRISQSTNGKGMIFTQITDNAKNVPNQGYFYFKGKNNSDKVKVGINNGTPKEALDVKWNIVSNGNIAATGNVDAGMKKNTFIITGLPTVKGYFPLKRDGLLESDLASESGIGNNRNWWTYTSLPNNIYTCRTAPGGWQDCSTDFSPILAVNGAGRFNGSIQAEFDANIWWYLRVNRDADIDGQVKATTYLYNSDARYKSAITPLDSALDKVLALQWYSYYNRLSDKTDIGVIAQEVEQVFPELVHTDDKWYKSVEYGNLVAPLIEAVKSLNDKVETQAAQLNDLEARLQALEAK